MRERYRHVYTIAVSGAPMRSLCLGMALPLLAPVVAHAQVTVLTRGQRKAPSTWNELKMELRRGDEPAWVVVEDPAQPMAGGFAGLLREEAMAESSFRVFSATVDGPFGKSIRAGLGWEGAHWGLLNSKGQLLIAGTRLPASSSLWEQLRAAGVQTRLEILEAFVARHPDQIEGREALLGERLQVARRRMAPFLKPQAQAPEGGQEPSLELARPLSDDDDARIWGRLAAELERFLLSGDYLKIPGWRVAISALDVAPFSPAMKAAALKTLPVVEDALREAPSSWPLWNWWERLATVAGGRPLRPLIASLRPIPGQRANVFPPEMVLRGYLQRAKAAKDWASIRDLLLPRWENEQQESVNVVQIDAGGKREEDGLGFSWDNYLAALLEAHLRLGETQEASRMVEAILVWMPGAVSLPRRASAMAKACGFDDLASRWSALRVAQGS